MPSFCRSSACRWLSSCSRSSCRSATSGLTGGKRIFRRAPIHHHWELASMPEVKIVFRFWVFAAVCAAVGLLLAGL